MPLSKRCLLCAQQHACDSFQIIAVCLAFAPQVPGVYQAGVYLWKCQDTTVSEVALFGTGHHAFVEWYGINNTCAPPRKSCGII